MEIWKTIDGYSDYMVSNLGRIKSFKLNKERILRAGVHGSGYIAFILWNEDGKKTLTVHRLVAKSFIPNPENKRTVNHINGIKTDNRVENLEWNTYLENSMHAFSTGLNFNTKNQRDAASKANSKKVIDTSSGVIYNSITIAAKEFGLKRTTLTMRLTGKNPNKTTLAYL